MEANLQQPTWMQHIGLEKSIEELIKEKEKQMRVNIAKSIANQWHPAIFAGLKPANGGFQMMFSLDSTTVSQYVNDPIKAEDVNKLLVALGKEPVTDGGDFDIPSVTEMQAGGYDSWQNEVEVYVTQNGNYYNTTNVRKMPERPDEFGQDTGGGY